MDYGGGGQSSYTNLFDLQTITPIKAARLSAPWGTPCMRNFVGRLIRSLFPSFPSCRNVKRVCRRRGEARIQTGLFIGNIRWLAGNLMTPSTKVRRAHAYQHLTSSPRAKMVCTGRKLDVISNLHPCIFVLPMHGTYRELRASAN